MISGQCKNLMIFKQFDSFSLHRNHEKPSKSLRIMRFLHCPEIMENRQSVLKL
jgi:hypothetical protein